jgi:hypothetical protein
VSDAFLDYYILQGQAVCCVVLHVSMFRCTASQCQLISKLSLEPYNWHRLELIHNQVVINH